LAPPFTDAAMMVRRKRGLVSVVDWLAGQPGHTWQERWRASGADELGNADWWRPWLVLNGCSPAARGTGRRCR